MGLHTRLSFAVVVLALITIHISQTSSYLLETDVRVPLHHAEGLHYTLQEVSLGSDAYVRNGITELDLTVGSESNSEVVEMEWRINRPCCVFLGPKRRDCFFRIRSQTLSHMIQYTGHKPQWQNLGAQSNSDIGCLSWGPSHMFVYQLAVNRTLIARSYYQGSWTPWIVLPFGKLSDIPSCLVIRSGVIQCMGRNVRNVAVVVRLAGGTWRWKRVPFARLKSTPSCIRLQSKEMHCFAVGPSDDMQHTLWLPEVGWMQWESLEGVCQGTPCPIVTGPTEVKVFVNSSYGRLSSIRWDGVSWSGWYIFDLKDPILQTEPECVASVHGRVDCFAGLKPEGRLHRISWKQNNWSKWVVYNYVLQDKPICRFDQQSLIWCLLLVDPPKWTFTSFKLLEMPPIA